MVFILQLSGGDQFTVAYAAVPYEITNGVDLVRPVSLPGTGVIPQAPGPTPIYLTLFTSMFMHGGFMHIIGNMLYLWIFGDNIEDNFGHVKFVIFYLICGLIAAFAQIMFDPDSVIPTLGASGAIAGVLGAYLVMFPHNRVRSIVPLGFLLTTVELPAIVVLGFWIVIQFFSQYAAITDVTQQTRGGGVAYMAHIGGFIAGLILSFFFRRRQPQPEYYE
jgi:membrane associated rhomboid family serine protease